MELINGEHSVVLGEGDFTLERVSYEPYRVKNTFCRGTGLSQGARTGYSLGEMSVSIEGYIKGDLEKNREILSKICDPSSHITLKDGVYCLEMVASAGVRLSSEKHLQDKLLKYTISAVAPTPLWHTDQISKIFYNCGYTSTDQNAIKITNEGNVPVGCIIEVYLATSANFVVLKHGEEWFKYEKALEVKDCIHIDTRYGQKTVMLEEDNSGIKESAIESVAPASDFFTLDVGENRIDFVVSEGVAFITIKYTPTYMR